MSSSSLVIEDMKQRFEAGQSPLPVYFYCSRSAAESERSNPDAVLASILRQLSCAKPGVPLLASVVQKYKTQGEGFKSIGLDTDECRTLILEVIENYGVTTIIVNALDECDPEERRILLDTFEVILQESAGLVKILVSSRDEHDIVCALREYPNLDVSSDKNTADINAFVKTETERLVSKNQLLRHSKFKPEMKTLIIDKVCERADGM